MKNRQSMFEMDYYRMTGEQYDRSIRTLKNILFMHNLRYVYWWRKASAGNVFAKAMVYLYSRKYGLEIGLQATIGKGLYLGHPYNITVSSGTVLGDNINLHKGVTIGAIPYGKKIGSPKIGNHVWIGINAIVVGNIIVGDDVLIAPGAYVNFDVPSHSIVIGNPGVIHAKEDAVKGYINFTV